MANSKKNENGPVVKFPFGTMIPPAELKRAIANQGKLESRLVLSRDEIKGKMVTFYKAFHKKYPAAGRADFARQFDAKVPQDRAGYKKDKTYLAIDNMFRYCPEIATGGKVETPAQKAARIEKAGKLRAAKIKATQERNTRGLRLLMRIVNQIGLPPALLTIAAQRTGFKNDEIEAMLNMKGSLEDVGLGHTILSLRATGVSVAVAMAKTNAKAKAETQALPTAAELASQAKGKPVVTVVPAAKPATTKVYKGKGQYQTVVLKAGDSIGKPNGHASA
jgi:hypothetical protein